jgi:hypothetical protein
MQETYKIVVIWIFCKYLLISKVIIVAFDMEGLRDDVWDVLLTAIENKKCTPFVGAGVSSEWIRLDDICRRWVKDLKYPLDDSDDLSKVAQFIAIMKDALAPNRMLSAEIQKIILPDFKPDEFRGKPPVVLADLNLPLYITTNYDQVLEAALKSRARAPITEFCRWNDALKELARLAIISSIFNKRKKVYLKEEAPIVYHLHGVVDLPQSMVLTERDYMEFVIHMNRDEPQSDLIPPIISQQLSINTLLFIGYRLEDLDFRVIFQSVIDISRTFRGQEEKRIAVQLPSGFSEEKKEQAQEYLERYTQNMFKVDVYWGDALDFVAELRERLDKFRSDRQIKKE